MEENKENIIEKDKNMNENFMVKNNLEVNNIKTNNNIINEEENINLLNDNENNESINAIKIKDDNINPGIKESLLKNKIDEIPKINNNENEKKIICDYVMTIQYTKFMKIPYFIFGNIINIYFPGYKFESQQINLSQIPTPPFTITKNGCK